MKKPKDLKYYFLTILGIAIMIFIKTIKSEAITASVERVEAQKVSEYVFGQNLLKTPLNVFKFPEGRMIKKNASPQQQEKVDYAWKISKDPDFIYTLEMENGLWTKNRLSNQVGINGYRDQGLCQLNRQYHLDFIMSPEFQDHEKQLDYCWEVYKNAKEGGRINTTFYGYNNRHKAKDHFILM